jgi:hypothetical protein
MGKGKPSRASVLDLLFYVADLWLAIVKYPESCLPCALSLTSVPIAAIAAPLPVVPFRLTA